MTDKQLKRLSRRDLLEMLIIQTRKVEALEAKLADTEQKLQDKLLAIEESGSLAEAVLRLNGVFEAAENAARQYLENIQNRAGATDGGEQDG